MAGKNFVEREMSAQESILLQRAKSGDYESLILFLESRRTDPSFDIRSLPGSRIPLLVDECKRGVDVGNQQAEAFDALNNWPESLGG